MAIAGIVGPLLRSRPVGGGVPITWINNPGSPGAGDYWNYTDYGQKLKAPPAPYTVQSVTIWGSHRNGEGTIHAGFYTNPDKTGLIGSLSDGSVPPTSNNDGAEYDFTWSSGNPVISTDCHLWFTLGTAGGGRYRHSIGNTYEDENYNLISSGGVLRTSEDLYMVIEVIG